VLREVSVLGEFDRAAYRRRLGRCQVREDGVGQTGVGLVGELRCQVVGQQGRERGGGTGHPGVVRLLVGEGVQQAVHLAGVLRHSPQRLHQQDPLRLGGHGVEEGQHLPVLRGHGGVRQLAEARQQLGELRRQRRFGGQPPVASLGQQHGEPLPSLPYERFLPREVLVQLLEDFHQFAALVVREDVTHLVEAEAELGQTPDAGEQDGVPDAVLAVAVAPPYGFGQQPEMVVVPHGPRGDPDEGGDLADSHGFSRNPDVAARSRRLVRLVGCLTLPRRQGLY
jgi:hypothetical protein